MEAADGRNVPVEAEVFEAFIEIRADESLAALLRKLHFFGKTHRFIDNFIMVAGEAVPEVEECESVRRAHKCGGENKNILVVLFFANEPKRSAKQQRSHRERRSKHEPKSIIEQSDSPAGVAVINRGEGEDENKSDGDCIAGDKSLLVVHNRVLELLVLLVRVEAGGFKCLHRGKHKDKLEHIEPTGVVGIVKENENRIKRRNKGANGAGDNHFF